MPDLYIELDSAIEEVTKARAAVARRHSKQVSSGDEIDQLRSVAYAWFRSHREAILGAGIAQAELTTVDAAYTRILESTHKSASRSTYTSALKSARKELANVLTKATTVGTPRTASTADNPPDFSSLAGDAKMQEILLRRWQECIVCTKAGAPLAATVMMGGLLEALCVARANKMPDKSPLFKAKATPLDPKTKIPIPLKDWTLRPYLDVGHEIGWLTPSAKDVGAVLRDYRNYIHPQKEYSHGVVLSATDAGMFWEVTKSLTRQILAS